MRKRRRNRVIIRPGSAVKGRVPPKSWRPKTRGECVNGPRPCPFYGCRYHLALDAQPSGLVVLPFGDDPAALLAMEHTCALDVADAGPQRNLDLSELLGISRQRVNQVEQLANAKLRHELARAQGSVPGDIREFLRP